LNQLKRFLVDPRYQSFLAEINEDINIITQAQHVTDGQIQHFYSLKAIKENKIKEEEFDAVSVVMSNPELTSEFIYVPDAGMFEFDMVVPTAEEVKLLTDCNFKPENFGGRWKLLHKEMHEVKLLPYLKNNKISSIMEMQKFHQLKTLEIDPMNKNQMLINTRTGVLEFHPEIARVCELSPIDTIERSLIPKREKLSFMINSVYKEDAVCRKWDKFLYEVTNGDVELMDVLQEYCGYCLLPSTKFEKSIILLGSGANGKSTFLNVWSHVIGKENISNVSMDELGNPFSRISMYGKLINLSSEMDASEVSNSSYFKSIVSGDSIEASYKFKSSISFRPFCKLMFAMNSLPKIRDREMGFYRKVIFVPFNQCFVGAPNRRLADELTEEAPGILAWAIRGLERLYANNGFTISKASDRILDMFRKENNTGYSYIYDNIELSPMEHEDWIHWDILYEAYKDDILKNGQKPLGSTSLWKEMVSQFGTKIGKERKYDTQGKRSVVVTGVRWKV
jgi:putative DNA primase/helicase